MNEHKDGQDHELEEWRRTVYERAQEVAHHSDVILYEVAAIVWSAEALLLGFVLEVPPTRFQQCLVMAASIVAIFLAAYVPYVMRLVKIGQREAFELCREIEEPLPEPLRLHKRITAKYPRRYGQVATWFLTTVFVIVWLIVLHRAINCVFSPACCG